MASAAFVNVKFNAFSIATKIACIFASRDERRENVKANLN